MTWAFVLSLLALLIVILIVKQIVIEIPMTPKMKRVVWLIATLFMLFWLLNVLGLFRGYPFAFPIR